MADNIKIKPKKTYHWNQDGKYVYLNIPLPLHTSLKKIEIFVSDLILRVTSLEKKTTHVLDLFQEIDFQSAQNKFILTDGVLRVTLKKAKVNSQWANLLIEDISLADLKIRRRESEKRYQQLMKKQEETKEKLRVEYDRKATQQLMRFQGEERANLQKKKEIEKQAAIAEVFSNINEKTGKIQKKIILDEQIKWKEKQQLALKQIEREEEEQRQMQIAYLKQKNQKKIIEQVNKQLNVKANNTMFTEQQIKQYDQLRQRVGEVEYEQIPVRKAVNQKVKFTERMYPNLAARDTFYKDPPLPKGKSNKHHGDQDNKNPLWLKDKGDLFFRDKNYLSAIQAYSEAINIDPKFFKAIVNRSLAYMKIFKLTQAIADADQCLVLLQSQIIGPEEADSTSSLKLFVKIKTRKALCLAWKGDLQTSKQLLLQLSSNSDLQSDIASQIKNCLTNIELRQESIKWKGKGDQKVKVNDFQKALPFYNDAVQKDENQYAISNKTHCLIKMNRYRQALQSADVGISKILKFNLLSQSENKAIIILLKLFYRKAKALQGLGLLSQAEECIKKGLSYDHNDKDLTDFLKAIKGKLAEIELKRLKEESAQLIKDGKIKEALEIYSKCLKILQSNDNTQQYLAILQNQCVCYLKLEQYDSIISTSIRILKIVNNLQAKVIAFSAIKSTIDPSELNKIIIRTYMRRANAYLKTNQIYNAKADLEKALQISPNDQTLRKQLQKLKAQL